ncbi:MAG: U32 family peptidase, partial [Prevotellaceae bacterium]|nr:U32 family peptidase [Prevotellaceae bacterium]
MAPVGSWDCLQAAAKAGANSVYFGIEGLNMRSRSANNFTINDLKTISDFCSENNLKSYLTVNTIIYDNDLELMKKIIDGAKNANISAIIASDVAAMSYAAEIGVEVHLSTQLNITNVEALKFYAQFADVVVLARELDMGKV